MQTNSPDSQLVPANAQVIDLKPLGVNVRDLMQQAIACHQQGDFSQAQSLYQQILAQQPKHFDALHLLGVIAAQQQDPLKAEQLMAQALQLNAGHDFVWANRGNALRELKRWEEALDCFKQAVTLNPNNAEAWNYLGDAQRALNQSQAAVESYQRAILLNPDDERALINLAILLRLLRRDLEALECFAQVISLNPQNADAFRERGNLQLERQQHYQAIRDFDMAINLQAKDAHSMFNRGVAFAGVHRFDMALESYELAMALDTSNPYLFFNRGVALEQLGRHEEALASYDEAVLRKVDFLEAYLNRGNILKALGRFEESVFALSKMIVMNPNYAEAYNNRANGLKKLGKIEQAIEDYNRAIEIKPDYHEALNNRGNLRKDMGLFDLAMQDYNQALTLNTEYISCHWNKSLLLILQGDYAQGWQLYEWRLQEPSLRDKHYQLSFPGWRGEYSLAGKTILVYAEQGYGDVIQFARYVMLLKEQGANVIFEVFQPLYDLMKSLPCEITLVSKGDPIPQFDTYCPVMSLPYAMKTSVETIPAPIPYLFANPSKVEKWQNSLGKREKMRVGFVWSGSTKHDNDANRSIPLQDLQALLQLDVEWHSLQKEYRIYDLSTILQYPQLQQHQDELNDFDDTAALISCMDLIITVDTSVAHLAGALGKPLWILVPFSPDYRWLLEREDSPWYPNAKLVRQPSMGDWATPIAKLVEMFKHELAVGSVQIESEQGKKISGKANQAKASQASSAQEKAAKEKPSQPRKTRVSAR